MPRYTARDRAPLQMPAKDPGASNKPYSVDLRTEGFLPTGTNITAASWSVSGDATLTVAASAFNTDTATVYLSGGTEGNTPLVTVRITTDLSNGAGGYYADDVSFYVPIRTR